MARIVRFSETGGPEVLKFAEEEVPPPSPGEILIVLKAFGLNRAEVMFRSGSYTETPEYPARLGYEGVGVVTVLGEGVTEFKVGDAVNIIPPMSITRWGTYGEVATVPAEVVVRHPDSMDWTEAAASWMQYVTAYGALIDIAKLDSSDTAVVTAASSSVGLAAIQVAKLVGATAIATTRTNTKREAILKVGADHVITTAEEDLGARIAELTGGAGPRIIFDPVGGVTMPVLVEAAAPGGIIIEYGVLDRTQPLFPMFTLLAKTLTIRGYRYKEIVGDPARLAAAKSFILNGIACGALRPVIDRIFTLDEIVDAHRYLESNQQFGKIVVTV